MRTAYVAITKAAIGTGTNFVYLPVPNNGRLRQVSVINLSTLYLPLLITTCPTAIMPQSQISTAAPAERAVLFSGIQGSTLTPVIWQGDIPMSAEYSVVVGRFALCTIGDSLEVKAEVEIP